MGGCVHGACVALAWRGPGACGVEKTASFAGVLVDSYSRPTWWVCVARA